jgi:hypothetical protein
MAYLWWNLNAMVPRSDNASSLFEQQSACRAPQTIHGTAHHHYRLSVLFYCTVLYCTVFCNQRMTVLMDGIDRLSLLLCRAAAANKLVDAARQTMKYQERLLRDAR